MPPDALETMQVLEEESSEEEEEEDDDESYDSEYNGEEGEESEEDDSEDEETESSDDDGETDGSDEEEGGGESDDDEQFESEPEDRIASGDEQSEEEDDDDDDEPEEGDDFTERGEESTDQETGDEETGGEETDDEEESSGDEDEFEDEPKSGPLIPYDEEYEDYTESMDIDELKQKSARKAILLCFCCCILLALAGFLIWWFLFKDDDEEKAISPTNSPTALLSEVPTVFSVIFPIVADTFLRGGIYQSFVYGKDEKLHTMKGPDGNETAYTLLQFDTSGLPPEESGMNRHILLRITHISVLEDRGPTDIVVSKLQPASSDSDIETLTWSNFTPQVAQVGPTFTVATDDSDIEVDITNLVTPSRATLRGRRNMQDSILLLMLESQSVGETFYSREFDSGNQQAEIVHSFVTFAPTQSPTVSTQPSMSAQPSMQTLSPSISSMPSKAPSLSSEPSISSAPTLVETFSMRPSKSPSLSNTPSVSLMPSGAPTVSSQPSLAPTTSAMPSISSRPSVSAQPSTCLEQFTPPMWDTRGATNNPFPDGAFEYVEQPANGKTVTVKIIQKWSTSNVAWIAPYYADFSLPENENRYCERTRNVAPDQELVYNFQCFGGYAIFNVIVSDTSLVTGPKDLLMDQIPGCESSSDDVTNKKVLYAFTVKCKPPPQDCLDQRPYF